VFNSFFLCVYFFFLCGLTHEKISFNLGEHNFSVRVRPTEKLFLTVNPQKKSIFLSFYFCGLFSDGTPSEKYFSDGIRIFPWVSAHTEKERDSSSASLWFPPAGSSLEPIHWATCMPIRMHWNLYLTTIMFSSNSRVQHRQKN